MPFSKDEDRVDTLKKCSGTTRYVGDLSFDNMLEAVTVRSSIRRGTIKKICLPDMPDGYFSVDASDIPHQNQITYFQDPCPYFAESEVKYLAQPIMLMVGPDLRIVRRLAQKVQIDYEEIAAIHTEDLLATTKRHPSRVVIRSALDAKGHILGVDIDVVFQAGGYALSCQMVLDTGLKKATGVYHFPAARVLGRAVATNNPMAGAYRGFDGPQTFFAIETHMNALARKFKRDPLQLKADYIIPTSLDAPPVESALIANPYPPGPYGAKCVGEP